jgi:hypothetical protein
MAGELCGTGCGFCGACEGQWEQPVVALLTVGDAYGQAAEGEDATEPDGCEFCGRSDCEGDCDAYRDSIADDIDARYEHWRDREVA